jgi:peptidoglycan/xylan/chitin deacetylase (PgdA/CDA1 family)
MKLLVLLFIHLILQSGYSLECQFSSNKELGAELLSEINEEKLTCLSNKVHLSFDDGPSVNVTTEILKELKLRSVKASFFVTTTNLDPVHPSYKENRKIVEQSLLDGHLIADHGHEHNSYDLRMDANSKILETGFSEEKREEQIKKSIDLLNWSTQGRFSKQVPLLFF